MNEVDQWGECKYGKDCKFSHGRRENLSQRSGQEGIEKEIHERDCKEEQNRKLDFLCEEIKNTRNQIKLIIMYHNLQQAYQQQMHLVSQQQQQYPVQMTYTEPKTCFSPFNFP